MHYALLEADALVRKKSEDYNGDSDANDTDPARASYFPYGSISYLHMLHIKFKRLESVVQAGEKTPNFESARDSLLDLINYSSFMVAHLDEELKILVIKESQE